MRIALGTFACLVAGIGALAAGSMLLEEREFIYLAVAMGAAGAFACSFCLGRYARPAWTAGIMPGLWVALAAAFSVTKGAIASPKIWLAVACGAVTLLVFWVDGRRRRR